MMQRRNFSGEKEGLLDVLSILQHLTQASLLRCFGKTKNPSFEGFDQIASAEKEGMELNLQYLDNVLFTGS
jgi:hypothetical protein